MITPLRKFYPSDSTNYRICFSELYIMIDLVANLFVKQKRVKEEKTCTHNFLRPTGSSCKRLYSNRRPGDSGVARGRKSTSWKVKGH